MTMDQMAIPAAAEVDLGPLTSSLGFLLRMAQLQSFHDFFDGQPERDLKPGTFSVLSIIGRNPGIRQGVLAQRLMIKPAHMTKLIRSLEDRRLVARRIPDHDRRAVELTLTTEGRDFIERHWPRFAESDRAGAHRLAARERDQLARLLRKFTGLDRRDGSPALEENARKYVNR